ncbi:MAG: hypothetical protein CMJ78_20890 [Planctomycetaceae bacterium]|nr:hypothetical protein [Planctomycetaceae bacterium]
MLSAQRLSIVLMTAFVCSLFGDVVLADDAKLQKRIAELEAENRALRQVIASIQSAIANVPKSTVSASKDSHGLRVMVVPGDWGGSQLEDIRKVCLSSAEAIWAELPGDGLAPIQVHRSKNGPISLYQRGAGREYIVKLDTGANAWAQCAFQFAHEFCHVLCNYRNVPNQQLWFEETLCEVASLYSLRRMGETWKTKPPYRNWSSYSAALANYAANRINKLDTEKTTIAEFYKKHESKLQESAGQRELNGYIAVKLLPMFEKNASAWQTVRYINLGPKEENESFKAYLSGWHDRVPSKHKPFVKELANEFGVELGKE